MHSQRFTPGKDASLESFIATPLAARAGYPEPGLDLVAAYAKLYPVARA